MNVLMLGKNYNNDRIKRSMLESRTIFAIRSEFSRVKSAANLPSNRKRSESTFLEKAYYPWEL